jgi:hypothetical protein
MKELGEPIATEIWIQLNKQIYEDLDDSIKTSPYNYLTKNLSIKIDNDVWSTYLSVNESLNESFVKKNSNIMINQDIFIFQEIQKLSNNISNEIWKNLDIDTWNEIRVKTWSEVENNVDSLYGNVINELQTIIVTNETHK